MTTSVTAKDLGGGQTISPPLFPLQLLAKTFLTTKQGSRRGQQPMALEPYVAQYRKNRTSKNMESLCEGILEGVWGGTLEKRKK